jgi:hypothetical protein
LVRYLFFFFLLAVPVKGFCQTAFSLFQNIEVKHADKILTMPFAGGINAAMIQEMDVDGDGAEELLIWDINARQVNAYKITGQGFTHLPHVSYMFPQDISGFMVLQDFDRDGRKDLFTSSPFGIKVYRNTTPQGSKNLQWTVAQNFIRLDNGSNVQANILDIPLITDLDGDGDLDIVTFNFASGDYLEYYRNTSMERKGTPDVDGFAFPLIRWGNFEFCGCGQFSFGITCSGFPIGRQLSDPNQARIQHAGGHSIHYADFNGDGINDLLMGQDECNSLYFLPNKGTNANPVFDSFETSLPDYGPLPVFPVFHSAYTRSEQLWISSHTSSSSNSVRADFARNVFAIESGSSLLTPFLQPDMIDWGENTRPFFSGNKSKGELLVSANSLTTKGVRGKIHRYITSSGSWELVDTDYLNFSNLGMIDLQYVEYFNAANRTTYWVAGVDTINLALRRKLFFKGTDPLSALKEVIVPEVGLGLQDHFAFFVYQSKDYLLLARQTGELVLYELSMGVGDVPQLKLMEREFLGFIDNPGFRNLTVEVINGQNPSLYAVDQRGVLIYIAEFMKSSARETITINLGHLQSPSRLGRNSWITHVKNPFSSSADLILGNTAGGLVYLKNQGVAEDSGEKFQVRVYPNPATSKVQIITSEAATARLITSQGKILLEGLQSGNGLPLEVDVSYFAPGLYIIQFTSVSGKTASQKLILNK